MNHPFNLSLSDLETLDLEFYEELTDEETEQVGGGLRRCGTPPVPTDNDVTTLAIGEEGGWCGTPSPNKPPKFHPPDKTTLALGEEGGGMTTMAIGEEGGDY